MPLASQFQNSFHPSEVVRFRFTSLRERYKLRGLLGAGTQGRVFLLENRKDARDQVAAKMARAKSPLVSLFNEVRILSTLPPNSGHRLLGVLLHEGVVCGHITQYY